MKDQPLLSVIVPVYNAEKYLGECLDSIIQQTYRNIEVIIVDDGSKDSSKDVYSKYVRTDDRVIAIHQKNKGVSAARNRGIEASDGEHILFVDADDFLAPDCVDSLVKASSSQGFADTTIGNFSHYHTGKHADIPPERPIPKNKVFSLEDASSESIVSLFTTLNSVWGKLIKRDLLVDNNIYFSEDLKIAEDFEFIVRVYLCSSSIVYLDKTLYNYRDDFDNNTSAMGSVSRSKAFDFGKALKSLDVFIKKHQYDTSVVKSAMPNVVVSHSLYGLTVVERDADIHREVFDYIHKDLFPYFGITEGSNLMEGESVSLIAKGDYPGFLLNRLSSTREYLNNRLEAVKYIEDELEARDRTINSRDDEIASLKGEIQYLKSPKGMIKSPIGRVYRKIKRTINRK